MTASPDLIGISVGPGDPELITVKALEALRSCDVLIAPRSRVSEESVARSIVDRYRIPAERFRTVVFEMDRNREALAERYREVAALIDREVEAGHKVGFLTLGDALTYSTWIYTLRAIRERCPKMAIETIPGVTSFSALAAIAEWPVGEQKEQVLTLPCPDDMTALRQAIESHDLVVLIKIGKRLPKVIELIEEMGIADSCILGRRVGMEDEVVLTDLCNDPLEPTLGYFATMLIRTADGRSPPEPSTAD